MILEASLGCRGRVFRFLLTQCALTCWSFPQTQDLSNHPLSCSALVSSRVPLVRFFNR